MSTKILDGRKLHLILMGKEEKIYALVTELKCVKDLNDSKSEAIQRLESELKKRDELLKISIDFLCEYLDGRDDFLTHRALREFLSRLEIKKILEKK